MWGAVISVVLGIAIIVLSVTSFDIGGIIIGLIIAFGGGFVGCIMDDKAFWASERERYQRERAAAASRGPEELERFERQKSMEIVNMVRRVEEERRAEQFADDLARKIGKELSKKY